jgi:hypothetical protein
MNHEHNFRIPEAWGGTFGEYFDTHLISRAFKAIGVMVLGCRCIDMSKGILTILKYTLVAIPRVGAENNRPPCTLPHLTKYIETFKHSNTQSYLFTICHHSQSASNFFFGRGVPKSAGTRYCNSESLAPVACQDFRHQASGGP